MGGMETTRNDTQPAHDPTTKPEKAPKVPTPCQCFSQVEYTLDEEDGYDVPQPVYGPCGEETTREFRQGHDAKLKSVLIALNRAGMEYHRVDGGLLMSDTPLGVAQARGWERFMTPAKPKAERKTKAEKRSVPEVVDTLAVMKAAAARLKASGQYGGRSKHRIVITTDNAASIADGTHPDLLPAKTSGKAS